MKNVEQIAIEHLIPYARNSRKHSDAQVAQVAASIREFGFCNPVLIDQETGIIAGHCRVLAARKLGMKEVPCIRLDHLTDTQRRAYIIADNKLALNAEWDTDLLALEMSDLKGLEFDLSLTGFEMAELDAIAAPDGESTAGDTEPQLNRAEALREQWGVQPGDLWLLGKHRLLCGDSTKAEDVGRVMDGEMADLCLTDPPYGVAYAGGTKDALTIENDDVDESTLIIMCKQWFDRADEVSRPGAYWIATVPSGPLHSVFLNDWNARGYLRQGLVWNKDRMVLGHGEYHYKHESIMFGWKPGNRLINKDRTKTTVWDFARPKASIEHPTMKPVDMWEYAIGNHTNPGNILYEPFSGSGTTIIACENLKRKCRAIEISPAYVAVALQRWADHTGKTPVRA